VAAPLPAEAASREGGRRPELISAAPVLPQPRLTAARDPQHRRRDEGSVRKQGRGPAGGTLLACGSLQRCLRSWGTQGGRPGSGMLSCGCLGTTGSPLGCSEEGGGLGRVPSPKKGHGVAGQGCDTLGEVPAPKGWRWGQRGRCVPARRATQPRPEGGQGDGSSRVPGDPGDPRAKAGGGQGPAPHLPQNEGTVGWQQDRAILAGGKSADTASPRTASREAGAAACGAGSRRGAIAPAKELGAGADAPRSSLGAGKGTSALGSSAGTR